MRRRNDPSANHRHGVAIALAGWLLASAAAATIGRAQPSPPPSATTAPELLSEAQKTELATLAKWLRDEAKPPTDRRDAATLLLNKGWAPAETALVETLSNKESPAGRLAVAEALAAEFSRSVARPSRKFVDPLLTALGEANDPLRRSASRALSAYADQPDVVERLRALAADAARPAELRRAAVSAFAQMPPLSTEVVVSLGQMLDDRDGEFRARVLDALNALTGVEINDVAARKASIAEIGKSSPLEWAGRVNRGLRQQTHQLRQDRDQIEKRLVAAVRQVFDLTPGAQQTDLLGKMLGDAQPAVRTLALELVDQTILSKSATVPEPIKTAVMARLTDESPRVRAAAADLVPYMDSKAGGQLLTQLAAETDGLARTRLVKSLGLLRSTEATGVLIKLLADSPDSAVVSEAATALGAIASRSRSLTPAEVEPVVAALLARYNKLNDEPGVRDALVGAMADVADVRFAPICLKNLSADSASLRLACARGLGNIAPLPQAGAQVEVLEALVARAAAEPDRGVRLAIVSSLAKQGAGKSQLKAIYERTNANNETDDSVRKRAWEGTIELLKSADKPTQLAWIGQIEENADPTATAKLIELLTAVEVGAMKSDQWSVPELSALSERLASALMRGKRPAEAAQRYEPEYQKLRAAKSDRAAAVAQRYLNALVAADQPTQSVGVLKDRLAVAQPAETNALADCLIGRIKALVTGGEAGGPTRGLAWVAEMNRQLPDQCQSAPWADAFRKVAEQAKAATSRPD